MTLFDTASTGWLIVASVVSLVWLAALLGAMILDD